jgi:predicted DNA-binding transcriptional regulator AlpA
MIRHNETTDELLNRAQVAALLGITPHTLACWRSEGRGPAVVKFGAGRSAAVRYRRSSVDAWISDPIGAESAAREPWREERRRAAEQAKARAAEAKSLVAAAKARSRKSRRRRRARA